MAEYERAVIFRLGRLRKGGSKGPGEANSLDLKTFCLLAKPIIKFYFFLKKIKGIFTVIPCIDTYRCVDLRTVSFDVPPQEVRIIFFKFQTLFPVRNLNFEKKILRQTRSCLATL